MENKLAGSVINWNNLQNTATPNFLAGSTIGDVVYKTFAYLYPAAAIMLFVYLLYGGLMFMFAAGDAGKAAQAKAIITNALIGLLIVIFAYWITQLVGLMLDIDVFGTIFV